MDPFRVLGVDQDASSEEVTKAYRSLAKRWHPDRGGGPVAAAKMSQINAAYQQVRQGSPATTATATAGRSPSRGARSRSGARAASHHGSWLTPDVRQALRPELLAALQRGEDVAHVLRVSLWASPHALLAVTDRRLLWLLDDVVANRVRSLRFGDVADVSARLSWPTRRSSVLRVTTTEGRRIAFAGLRPRTAEAIVAQMSARRSAAV